jgi:hypothetical protein
MVLAINYPCLVGFQVDVMAGGWVRLHLKNAFKIVYVCVWDRLDWLVNPIDTLSPLGVYLTRSASRSSLSRGPLLELGIKWRCKAAEFGNLVDWHVSHGFPGLTVENLQKLADSLQVPQRYRDVQSSDDTGCGDEEALALGLMLCWSPQIVRERAVVVLRERTSCWLDTDNDCAITLRSLLDEQVLQDVLTKSDVGVATAYVEDVERVEKELHDIKSSVKHQ